MNQSEKLLTSDRAQLLPVQAKLIAEILENAKRSLVGDRNERFGFNARVDFTPSQDWIGRFAEVGFFFYPYGTPGPLGVNAFTIKYDERAFAKENEAIAPWVPQNGEEVQFNPEGDKWLDAKFIGLDYDGIEYVLRAHKEEYICYLPSFVRPKPQIKKVELSELLETYAKLNGIDVDNIEVIHGNIVA